MSRLKELYRRLDLVQRTFWFKIAASVLVVAVCGGLFGYVLVKSYSLNSQRTQLFEALATQNINRSDEHAVTLRDSGEVFLGGRTYGGSSIIDTRYDLFDPQGNIREVGLLVSVLLSDQVPTWTPGWLLEQRRTTWMLALAATMWLLLIVWMEITVAFGLTLLGTGIPVGLCAWLGYDQGMVAFAGIGLLTFTFVLLTRAVLLGMQHPNQALAVAHAVVKEASRTWVALAFIVALLALLPLLPLWLDPASPLRYRVQTFISRSMGLTFFIAACMTLFLSCATVAFEIRDRQIWQLMTKPLGRFNYLIGKWLGVMIVNAIILIVAGVSIFTFIQYLRAQPVAPGVAGQLDALAVSDEVLTARVAGYAEYPKLDPEQVRLRVAEEIRQTPHLAELETVPLRDRVGIEAKLQQEYGFLMRSVPPWNANQSGPNGRTFKFSGLKKAKNLGSTLSVRYRFHILRDDEHQTFRAAFMFNGDRATVREATYVPTMSHNFPIGPDLIRDDGTLEISIFNLYRPPPDQQGIGALNFDEKDLELLYKAGDFESNFFRAMLTLWIKLAFLASLGVCCATFLSFPVACLLSFTIMIAGILGPFLHQALDWYYPPETSQVDWGNIAFVLYWAFEWFTRIVALIIVFLLAGFGEYKPSQSLVEGRLIEWTSVLTGALKLGVLWSGLAMIIGFLVMRKRQLAIYSGQG